MEYVKLLAIPPYYLDGALRRAGEAAEVLFVRALAHCGNAETAGRVDKAVIDSITPIKAQARADALVREGLWMDQGDYYLIRSWARIQDEHDALVERKRRERDRKRETRRREREAAEALLSADTSETVRGQSADSPRPLSADDADCPRQEPRTSKNVTRTADADASEFDAWWAVYPRKVAKPAARKAYAKARKTSDAAVLLAGARRYAIERQGQEVKYTRYPATWLNDECWADETNTLPLDPVAQMWGADDQTNVLRIPQKQSRPWENDPDYVSPNGRVS